MKIKKEIEDKLTLKGKRVVKGPDWIWGNQDGYGPGTIISDVDDTGWVTVEWDRNVPSNKYRMGALEWGAPKFDLTIIE